METIPEKETSRTVQSAVKHCEDKAAQVSDFPYVEQVFKDIESIELSEAMNPGLANLFKMTVFC